MSDKPAMKFKIGFVTATIWKNDNGGNKYYTVNLSRSYKKDDGYENTDQLGQQDLLNAAKVLQRAESWISDQ